MNISFGKTDLQFLQQILESVVLWFAFHRLGVRLVCLFYEPEGLDEGVSE